jgi:valyl-tRNA synthetase
VTLEVPANVSTPIARLLAHFATASLDVGTNSAGEPLKGALDEVKVRAPHGVLAARYGKDVERLRAEVDRLEKKLDNAQFVSKASPEVVAKERSKLEGYRAEYARAEAALAALGEPAR